MTDERAHRSSPIIVIGMHRSGTSLVARTLEQSGVLMGKKKGNTTENCEAIFFRMLNAWLLSQSSAEWDRPEPIDLLLSDPRVRSQATRYLTDLLQSPAAASFLGWPSYLRHRDIAKLSVPWGWKDPRNTYTLPVWLDIFPECKVIHVHRNGVDVANSLNVRARKHLAEIGDWIDHRRRRFWLGRHLFPTYTLSLRCLSLRDAFALWEAYVERALEHMDALPNDRKLSVRYEDFVTDPVPAIAKLHAFAGIEADPALTDRLASQFKPSRARAYGENPELLAFYESVADAPLMKRLAYELDHSSRA